MNISRYIASRLANSKTRASNYSRPVIVIGIVSIVLSLSIMIISTSVVTGFKKAVTQKIAGIGSHITITTADNNASFETAPLVKDVQMMNTLLAQEYVTHIQPFAVKHAILRTKTDIQGILIKGVDETFNWEKFSPHIIEGEKINPADTATRNEIMITRILANAIGLKTGDSLFTFYISQPQKKLSQTVIKQHASNIFYSLIPSQSIYMGDELIYNTTSKSVANFFFFLREDSLPPLSPRMIKVRVKGIYETGIPEVDKQMVIGHMALVQSMYGWTSSNISGYEVYIDDMDHLDEAFQQVAFQLPPEVYPSDIRHNYQAIFEWLPAIDINGIIIIILMVLVSVMAMLSTLLILIMEKTEMIGILKALGMNNWGIRKVFLWHASHIIIRGMLIGNIIGIGFVLVQHFWHPITMDQETYYLPYVPAHIDWVRFLLINAGTFLVCLLALIIPSVVVSRISPVKAIRMD